MDTHCLVSAPPDGPSLTVRLPRLVLPRWRGCFRGHCPVCAAAISRPRPPHEHRFPVTAAASRPFSPFLTEDTGTSGCHSIFRQPSLLHRAAKDQLLLYQAAVWPLAMAERWLASCTSPRWLSASPRCHRLDALSCDVASSFGGGRIPDDLIFESLMTW